MKYYLIGLVLLLGFFNQSDIIAQEAPCPCCTDHHQKFDFWVGDWIVYDTVGNEIGTNSIHKLEDGCILNENWIGGSGSTGKSYNYFNLQDSTWNQLWIDNSGSHLELKGDLIDGQMVLESELLPGRQIPFYKNRITWRKNVNGTVSQTWDILNEKGELQNTVFVGIYKKKE